jgi:hypothetical protein
MSFKITPLFIFLSLLIILIGWLMLCSMSNMFPTEGFVSFNHSETPMTKQSISQYSDRDVYKLYDSIYFDNLNGTLINVGSPEFSGNVDIGGNTATSGNTVSLINSITTMPRNSEDTYTYDITSSSQILPEPTSQLNSSYKSQIYVREGIVADDVDEYNVFYIPWGKKTYIHILDADATSPAHEYSYLFNDTSVVYNQSMDGVPLEIGEYVQDNDSMNNNELLEPNYNTTRKVYQISKYVKYDKKNGNIIITNTSTNSIDVYKRNSTSKITINISDDSSEKIFGNSDEYTSVEYKVRLLKDTVGKNTVLYITNSFDTIIVVVGRDFEQKIMMKSVHRFTPNGLDDGTGITETNNNAIEYDAGNANDSENSGESNEFDLNDYMLKTQIVPPVCPASPSCPSCTADCGSCSNCGGNGGSGTLSTNGDSTVMGDAVSNISTNIGTATSGTVGAVGDVANSAVGTASNVAVGAVGAAGDVGAGALGAAGDVGSGVLGAAGDVGAGALGAAGGILSGAVGAVGDVGASVVSSGNKVVDAAGQNNQSSLQQGNSGVSASGVQPNGASDPYSYYGQVPAKPPSDFIGITADFSSFGK